MTSDTALVAIVLAGVLGFIIVLESVFIVYLFWNMKQQLARDQEQGQDQIHEDIENHFATTNSFTSDRVIFSNNGGIISKSYPSFLSDCTSHDYQDAMVEFVTERESPPRLQLRDIMFNRNTCSTNSDEKTSLSTLAIEPSSNEQVNQFDEFSRTLMVQHLIQTSLGSSGYVKMVADPYLENDIIIGSIVVILKPFPVINLQPGDLLRIIKFDVKESFDHKALNINTDFVDDDNNHQTRKSSDNPSSFSIGRNNEVYHNIYCTGILMNTYLEFDSNKETLVMKVKNTFDYSKQEIFLKEFPLKIASLETTVLRPLYETS